MREQTVEDLSELLNKDTDTRKKYNILMNSVNSLQKEADYGHENILEKILPIATKIIETFSHSQTFSEEDLGTYIQQYKLFYKEQLKYQVWLTGYPGNCKTVESLMDNRKVHICGISADSQIGDKNYDYIFICGGIDTAEIKKIEAVQKSAKIIRYDLLQYYAYRLSPEGAYLDIKLRQKIESGIQGAVTGMSYEQRGLNYDKLERNLACLANPSQDLYLDYHNFLWLHDEIVHKRHQDLKYCILGMDFYRLWYDMSMSPEKQNRMLFFYNRIKCLHHYYKVAGVLANYEEDLRICNELMIKNYMDKDFEMTVHPETVEWYRTETYQANEENRLKDIEEIKQIFHKPYPLTFDENTGILEKFIKFLYLNNIKILVFIPPFPKIFNEHTPAEMKRSTLEVLKNLQNKFKFHILDLSEDPAFTDNYFADWSHLNTSGADLTTAMLNDYMNQIWKNC